MNSLFVTVLSLSLAGSLFIVPILICKPLFKDHLSKRWQYYIWLVVIARLLLPFTIEPNIVGIFFQKIDPTVTALIDSSRQDDFTSTEDIGDKSNNKTQTDVTSYPKNNILKKVLTNLWLIWLMVALILFIRKVTIYQSFVRYIKAGRNEVSDINSLEEFGEIIEQSNIKGTIGIYTNNLISSPLLIGFFRPYIVLPTLEITKSDFQYTILHELAHYKHGDMFYKWLVQLTICLHWFNPFIYLMGREINQACEFSCDEAVIKNLDYQEIRAYGDTLLNAMGIGGNYKDSLASITLNESKELLKERLDMIIKFEKKSKFITTVTLILTILMCMGAAATGAYAGQNNSPTSTPSIPWQTMESDTGQGYVYSQSGYYQEPYIFVIGWNLNKNGYESYPNKTEIKLSDLDTITVSFDSTLQADIQNQEVLLALTTLLERLNTQFADSSLPLINPLVVSVKYVGDDDLKKLAEEYYINGELVRFSAIFSALDYEIQKEFVDRIFQDNKNSFLSSNLRNMNTDLINYCAERAYLENNIAFFTNIIPYLTDDTKQVWIVRASQDKRNTFLTMLSR